MNKMRFLSFCIFFAVALLVSSQSTVSVHLTKGDQTVLLEQQADVEFSKNFIENNTVISVDENTTYQSIVGSGWTLTQGSAKAIRTLVDADQDVLLNELFHPENGIRSSLIRISIGASDLSESTYSYNEMPFGETDTDLSEFSLDGFGNIIQNKVINSSEWEILERELRALG